MKTEFKMVEWFSILGGMPPIGQDVDLWIKNANGVEFRLPSCYWTGCRFKYTTGGSPVETHGVDHIVTHWMWPPAGPTNGIAKDD